MGVLGLWQILESVGHPVKLDGLEGKRLGVDANVWLYKFIRGFREKETGTSLESHKLGLFNRISKLLYYKIKPVFVFDGPAPTLKRKTLERRQDVRVKNLSKVQDAAMRALAEQLKKQYPDANIDQLKIHLPEFRSNGLVAAEKLTDEDRDLFYLPPETVQLEESDESEPELFFKQEYQHPSRIDINSKEFESLPPEIRYEILHDIKSQKRRVNPDSLPEDPNSFSNFQLKRLQARRSVQAKIEKCEQDICQEVSPLVIQNIPHDPIDSSLDTKSNVLNQSASEYVQKLESSSHTPIKTDINASHSTTIDLTTTTIDLTTTTIDLTSTDLTNHIDFFDQPSTSQSGAYHHESSPTIQVEDFDSSSSTSSCLSVQQPTPNHHGSNSDEESPHNIALSSPSVQEDYGTTGQTDEGPLSAMQTNGESSPDIPPISSGFASSRGLPSPTHSQQAPYGRFHFQETEGNQVGTVDPLQSFSQSPSSSDIEPPPVTTQAGPSGGADESLTVGYSTSRPSSSNVGPLEECDPLPSKTLRPPQELVSPTDSNDRPNISKGPAAAIEATTTSHNKDVPPEFSIPISENQPTGDNLAPINQSSALAMNSINVDMDHEVIPGKIGQPDGQDLVSNGNHLDHQSAPCKAPADGHEVEQPSSSSSGSRGTLATENEQEKQATTSSYERLSQPIPSNPVAPETGANAHTTLAATKRVTTKIVEEAKELLRLFGVPYIDAAGEAEAQCALLEELKLTDGTITDDSDVWLFGAQNVYRYFFSDDKYVMQYKLQDINFHLRLSRENMVCFAMLVGSDYTDGIMNVGPVTALEILSEFPGDGLEPLLKFKEWRDNYRKAEDKKVGNKNRTKLLKYRIPDEFPSRTVFEGYLKPATDTSSEKFTWGTPELDELRIYAQRNFGWDLRKTDEKLLPVLKRMNERKTQMTIDSFFFKTAANQNPEMFRSKRVNQALNKIAKRDKPPGPVSGEVVCLSELSDFSEDDGQRDGRQQVTKTKSKGTQRTKKKKTATTTTRRKATTTTTTTRETKKSRAQPAAASKKASSSRIDDDDSELSSSPAAASPARNVRSKRRKS